MFLERYCRFDADLFSKQDLRIPFYAKIKSIPDAFQVGVDKYGTALALRCVDCYTFRDFKLPPQMHARSSGCWDGPGKVLPHVERPKLFGWKAIPIETHVKSGRHMGECNQNLGTSIGYK